MTCNTPRKGDRITVFAKVVGVDNGKLAQDRPWLIEVAGSAAQIWIGKEATDRIVERPLGVGDRVHHINSLKWFGKIIAVHNDQAWVEEDGCRSPAGYPLNMLKRPT